MLIKTADDKSKRLDLLTDLQRSPLLDAHQRSWLRDELMRTQRGIEGERDAAHYIDSAFKDSANLAVIHDLRIVVDGDVAQIDHLIVNRALMFYLLETKCFGGSVQINDRGEFSVEYPGDRVYGIPSPMEQSHRHERVLLKLLEKLEITGRLGVKPRFFHAVLLHPKAVIDRPDRKAFNTDNVIKADQISSWHKRHIDEEIGVTGLMTGMLNFHSTDTARGWAEKIARQHRPPNLLDLPEFMKPRELPPPSPVRRAVAQRPPAISPPATLAQEVDAPPEELRRKLVCVTCREKITFPEGKFCWANERRFGGFQYCRQHQGLLA